MQLDAFWHRPHGLTGAHSPYNGANNGPEAWEDAGEGVREEGTRVRKNPLPRSMQMTWSKKLASHQSSPPVYATVPSQKVKNHST